MRLANPALALVGALLLAGCSAGDADPTDPTPAAGTATAQAPDPTAEAEPAESTGPDGETIEPLFDTSRPGPDGLGVQTYYGPLGLCVLESDDLYWCVSAGGLGADLGSPEAISIMEQMATLVDGRIDA